MLLDRYQKPRLTYLPFDYRKPCHQLATPEPLSLICPDRIATLQFSVSLPQRAFSSGFVCVTLVVEQHRQLEPCDLLVGELRPLILRHGSQTGWQVDRADGAVGLVDMLPARS